jgi:CelD/BcsL family acetyltransferase involved in cellulose biosynthesis
MVEFTLSPPPDLPSLARRWRALEAHANAGVFRGWTYLSTHYQARFPNPLLLAAQHNGTDLALALLNRRGGKLHLHETGDPTHDAVFIEHNGLLTHPDAPNLLPAALATLARHAPVILSGVDTAHLQAAQAAGAVVLHQSRLAPAVDLTTLPPDPLNALSANTRAQIRRALRLYGNPTLAAAANPAEALDWFTRLVALHQQTWQQRGKPGAFATPTMLDFHKTLIAEAVPRGEADILRITAGTTEIGYLYTLRQAGRVFSYQSGLAPAEDPRLKPGLVCHTLAIAHYRAQSATTYDLLAGPTRYKLSLAPNAGQTLHWLTLHPKGLLARLGRRHPVLAPPPSRTRTPQRPAQNGHENPVC